MAVSSGFSTPVLLLVFNRPETTRRMFDTVRFIHPQSLFVSGDGPRPGEESDIGRCLEVQRIATTIDWPCELKTLFRGCHLGGGPAVASAISWFFEQVPEGIVLEDDCVPGQSFYRFCQELLAYYRDVPRIMHISGHNFQYGRKRGGASYYFSSWTHSGGWATWRRAWKHYDFSLIPEGQRQNVWDGQWRLTVERQHGVAVLPNANLVTNIGYGGAATHTRLPTRAAFLAAHEMDFPLRHPDGLKIDRGADLFTYYANIRGVRHLNLIRFHRLADFLALIPTRVGKGIARLRGAPRAPQ